MMNEQKTAPMPFTAKANRIYTADGEEIAVATKSSPRYRIYADDTAAMLTRAANAHLDLVEACKSALDTLLCSGCQTGDADVEILRAALAKAKGVTE